MTTRQYYYLTTIDACGNLSRAAQALGVSPSALSKFLAECERSFGFVLFLRYGRRLHPPLWGALRSRAPSRYWTSSAGCL